MYRPLAVCSIFVTLLTAFPEIGETRRAGDDRFGRAGGAPGVTLTEPIEVVARDLAGEDAFDRSLNDGSIEVGPELAVSHVTYSPGLVAPGGSITVTDTVSNAGNAEAAASTTRYYLSLDATKSGNDVRLSTARAVAAIGAGAQSTASTTVVVSSSVAPAVYFLFACADDLLKVAEVVETNNCTAAASSLRIDLPDLVLASLGNPPTTGSPGGAFPLSSSAHNQGATGAGGSRTRFYLSADAIKGSGDLQMTGYQSVGALAPGATATTSTKITIPAHAASGTWLVLGCVDDSALVRESAEDNNCRASASTILIGRPDLIITSVSNPPSVLAPGVTFTVLAPVQNSGAVGAGTSTERYYLSLDAVKNAGDVLFSQTLGVPSIAAGATSSTNRSVTVPAAIGVATYHVLACADDLAKVAETDETNNCRNSGTTVHITLPDLMTTATSTPPPYLGTGQSFSFTDTVENEGEYAVTRSTTSRYYLSTDGVKDAGDILLSTTRSVPVLSIGQASTLTRTLTVPSTTPDGRYVVLACADDLGQVRELDEENCWVSKDFAVGLPNTRPIAHAGADTDATIGTTFQLDGTASSDGDDHPLTYAWSLLAVPAGSGATISDPASTSPTLTADVDGQYVVQLVVHDGREFSVADVATFTTGGATRFAAIGDTGKGNAEQYAGAAILSDTCQRSGCDFIVMLGDNIYSSGVDSANDPMFQSKFEQPYANIQVPFYAVLGNHDYGGGGVGDEFYKGQFQIDYSAHSSKWRMPAAYYRFTAGSVEFFGLDTNMQMYDLDAEQRVDVSDWLTQSTARWKITLGHHPYRSNGAHGNAGSHKGSAGVPLGEGVKSFMEQVVCGRADVLLSGHDHTLQWLQPHPNCSGTELMVSGSITEPRGVVPSSSPLYNPVYFQSGNQGLIYLTVTVNQLTAEFVGSRGETLYVRTISKTP
jgi:tartrate-resistant acid phosphatase type 5